MPEIQRVEPVCSKALCSLEGQFKTDAQEMRNKQGGLLLKFETSLSLAEMPAIFSNFLNATRNGHMNTRCRLV
jgi:hypothetical protein